MKSIEQQAEEHAKKEYPILSEEEYYSSYRDDPYDDYRQVESILQIRCRNSFIAGSKATSEAGVWVKATERLPEERKTVFIKWTDKYGDEYNTVGDYRKFDSHEGIWYHDGFFLAERYDKVLWLDESSTPSALPETIEKAIGNTDISNRLGRGELQTIFFIDEVKALINAYNKREISISKLSEVLNVMAYSSALQSENDRLRAALKEKESQCLKLMDEIAIRDSMIKIAKRER